MSIMTKKVLKNQRGVTLIELLAVIVILGIIAAIAIPAVMSNFGEAKKNADDQTYAIVKEAVQRYVLMEKTDLKDITTLTFYLDGTATTGSHNLVKSGYIANQPKLSNGNVITSVTVTISNYKITDYTFATSTP